jgi:hypothetical protein
LLGGNLFLDNFFIGGRHSLFMSNLLFYFTSAVAM